MSNRRNNPSPAALRQAPAAQALVALPQAPSLPTRAYSHAAGGVDLKRQARFITLLAQTGCVRGAAQAVGLSRQSACRLRHGDGSHAARLHG